MSQNSKYPEMVDPEWRKEAPIDEARKDELNTLILTKPEAPFDGLPINRADIEWLLASSNSGKGPKWRLTVFGSPTIGLNLKGANLDFQDLSKLPLWGTQFQAAKLGKANLSGCDLHEAQFQKAELQWSNLQNANFSQVSFQEAYLFGVQFQNSTFSGANFQSADLSESNFENANLRGTNLIGTKLERANLEKVDFRGAKMAGDTGVGPIVIDVSWKETNLAFIDWNKFRVTGDENIARNGNTNLGTTNLEFERILFFKEAIRANKQLSLALKSQDLSEEADHFTYYAKNLQKDLAKNFVHLEKKIGIKIQRIVGYFINWLLWAIAGYGFRLKRAFCWYFGILIFFGLIYMSIVLICTTPSASFQKILLEAIVTSINAFHGRATGSIVSQTLTDNPFYLIFSGLEAIVGLVIEIILIATFTQKVFGR